MSVSFVLAGPFAIQSVAMLVDELYFHRRRGLGAWERIGHPLDTLTVLACVGWALFTRPTSGHLAAYAVLAGISCLFVTKDEFVHARRCTAGEHWLHALLFVLHPLTLACVAIAWRLQGRSSSLPAAQFIASAGFGLYQLAYWNLPWPKRASPR